MTPQISAAYCGDFRHGSISIDGALPQGAPHMWAHSLTDLACALRRDAGAGRFRDHDGAVLAQGQIDSAIAALEAAGFRPGDVGLIEAANTLPVIATILAVWELGGVVCPIDPDCPDAVRALVAQESGATVLVPANAAPHPLTTERPGRKITLRRPLRVTGVDLAMMIFTSGSSGRPKGVVLTHNNVMSALRAIVGYTGIGPEDRIFAVPPFFFDYGLYQVLIALLTGCELVVANAHRAVNKLAPILAQTQPTILPVVPALASGLGRMLEMTARSVPSVRLVTNTGGHLSEATIALLSKVLPNAAMMPMYGLTECKRATYCDRRLYPDATDSIGVAMPGLEAAVVVDTPEGLREAQPGETGELWVRGTSVMQSYRGAEANGAGARLLPGRYRADNWLATGDLLVRDARGLLRFKGRAKSLIKQGGYCIVPRDVEEMVEALPEVEAAVLVGREEASGDEAAVLFVQPAGADTAEVRKSIRAALKTALPRSLAPREVIFVTDWPATANGKIDRNQLTKEACK